jgi:3-hydroxyisobutyrate dehydrogenase-like beta-hydroxyacid dehydrogenase
MKIGFVALAAMGSHMVARLPDSGYDVVTCGRSI